ncbi:MAG: tyrosine-type recombinase/integrase [Chloroflexi bacterium]|nr:integrase [Chloroflexota bacterium]NOG64574.1 tyrosine-type recombinase/integrase [Chloroflexota bacterium]
MQLLTKVRDRFPTVRGISSLESSLAPLAYSLPLDQNPAAVYLASLNTEQGRRTMLQALNTIADILSGGQADALTCDWGAVRYQHVMAVRAQLAVRYKPGTVNKMLSALRGVLKAAKNLGQMPPDAYSNAVDIRGIKNATLPAGRELSAGEIGVLLMTCGQDNSPAGVRDAALIAVLYGAGLRRAEIVELNLADYVPDTGKLVVQGKGQKERIAWLNDRANAALSEWLTVRGDEDGPLFWHINKADKLVNRRLTTQAIFHILRKRGDEAGLRDFSPHDLRRTFVSDLLDAGADIATVARMAGHANIQTTARYDRRPEETKRRAAGLLHIPYHKKRPD